MYVEAYLIRPLVERDPILNPSLCEFSFKFQVSFGERVRRSGLGGSFRVWGVV